MTTATQTTALETQASVRQLRRLAVRALTRMYRPQQQAFAFRRRRGPGGDHLEGVSRRYTSTVLIALAAEGPDIRDRVLHGDSPHRVCGRMVKAAEVTDDLGEAALALWAARALDHPQAGEASESVRRMAPASMAFPTVETAWTLSALLAGDVETVDWPLANEIARILIDAQRRDTGLFPHWPSGEGAGGLRSHVTCFADFVYPILAMAAYCRATGSEEAREAAIRCAQSMCALQGPEGQWWWHFDVRTGRVVEQFPVYTVHQDAMAPMALRAVETACGADFGEATASGVRWLFDPPETNESLVDLEAGMIWRKVARREPGKLARGIQAAASRLHRNLRAPGLNLLLRPGWIDYECRPYHMGWILYAWRHADVASAAAEHDSD